MLNSPLIQHNNIYLSSLNIFLFASVLGESESAFDDDGSVLPFCIKIVP